MGIEGNEVADVYAKKGCSKEPLDLPLTLVFIIRQAIAMMRDEIAKWWTNSMPELYILRASVRLVSRSEYLR
jgi:hypothetical protein